MADFSSLKQTIQAYVKQNGNEEITGNILQDVLLAVVTTMGDGAINSLTQALQEEAAARQNADVTLQGNIGAEATARANADNAFTESINGLQLTVNAINTKLAEGYVYAGMATPSYSPGTPNGKVFYIAITAGTYTNFGNLNVSQGVNILKYNGSVWSKDVVSGIDDEPVLGSNSLVKSGGVAKALNILNSEVYQQNVKAYYGYYVNNYNTGSRTPAVGTNNGIMFFVEGGKSYKHNIPRVAQLYGHINSFQVFDKDFNNLGHPTVSNGSYVISSQDAMFLLVSVNTSYITDVTSIYLRENGNMYNELDGKITDINNKVNDINGVLDTDWKERNTFFFNQGYVNLIGTDGVPIQLGSYTWVVRYFEVIEGKKYRLSGLVPSYLAASGVYLTYSIVSDITVGADGKLVVNTSDVVQVGCTNNEFVNNYNSTIDITIPTGGKYIICSTRHAYQLCIDLEKSEFENIICWGDSLTAQGWPTELQYLVGGHYNVVNRGIGGQDAATIAGRQGGSPFYLVSDVTLPADTSRVMLPIETIEGNTSLGIASKTNGYVHYTSRLLCQGDYFNNVNIDGIDCILTKDGENIATAYYLQRVEAASESEVLKAGSILYGSYFKEARNTDISVVFIGQNGGYNSPETLVMQVKKMIGFTSCGSKFIAITSHGNGNPNIQEAFTNEFGSKVLNLQWYLPNYGIIDAVRFGLATASEMAGHTWDDGTLKPSDDVHLTALGYQVVANKVYEMMDLLGYFD